MHALANGKRWATTECIRKEGDLAIVEITLGRNYFIL